MSDQQQDETTTRNEETKTEETKESSVSAQEGSGEQGSETGRILDRATKLQSERLSQQKAELLEIEKRLDTKVKEFEKFISETEVQGRALAVPQIKKSKEELEKEEANKFLDGTGLEI